MSAATAAKSRASNLLEGMALSAVFQALPVFASAALLLKLAGSELVGHRYGAAIFVGLASLAYAAAMPLFAPRFPRFFKQSYEPLFFDTGLSFAEKFSRWREQPNTAARLVTTTVMLSLLAVAVASMG